MGRYQKIGFGGLGKSFGTKTIQSFCELFMQRVLSNDSDAGKWGVHLAQRQFPNAQLLALLR
jgi:hypothetical protein